MNILTNKLLMRNLALAGAGLVGLTTGVYWYHGAYSNINITEEKFGPQKFIYYSRVGNYETLGKDWQNLAQEVNSKFDTASLAGIYYDNPKFLEDPNQARIAMGFIVGDCEQSKIQPFLDRNPKFKYTILPEVKSFSTSFPYKSTLSFKIVKDKIYPSFREKLAEKKIGSFCLVEQYLFNIKNKKINFNVPNGEGSKQYFLM